LERFLATPNLYMLLNGDLIHNVAVHRTLRAAFQQVMTPEQQMLAVADLAAELVERGKLLAVTLSEEHDMRDARLTGHSTLMQLLRDKKVPLFNNRGCLVLKVGGWHYVIYCVHKSRYYSFLNQLHSGQREFQLGIPANVVVTSHTDRPAWGKYPWYPELRRLLEYLGESFPLPFTLGEEVYLVQTGSYEVDAEYGVRQFGLLPRPKPIILVFWPDRFKIAVVESFEDAERYLGLKCGGD